MTLRITAEDLLKGERNPFNYTHSKAHASGLIHESHACMIVPVSNEARLDLMVNHGQPYDEKKNEFRNFVNVSHPTEMNAGNLRRAFKVLAKDEMWEYKGFTYDPALIKPFTKHFKWVNDTFTLHGGGNILFIVGPNNDWGYYIAPHVGVDEDEEEKPKTFNPATGEWE